MMQSYLFAAFTAAPPCAARSRGVPGLRVTVDLQIIQGVLQVKTAMPATGVGLRISLGFKQLARGLHAAVTRTGSRLAAVLAATAVIGISLSLEKLGHVGVVSAALQPTRGIS
jgi:hypothetical protein